MKTVARFLTEAVIAGAFLYFGIAWAVALVVLAYCAPARGEAETWAVLSCCSHHFDSSAPKDNEQRNWGAGLEHGSPALRAVGGVYRNSKRVDSVYFGGVATAPVARVADSMLRLGAAAVLVSGYEKADKRDGKAETRE